MKKKYLILIIITLLILPLNVFAKAKTECDYSLLSNMKRYASNINFIYDYRIENNNAYFNVTINNLTADMYLVDEITGQRYNYSSTNNGELIINGYSDVETLKYKVYSNNSECMDEILIINYINLPVYNKYSGDPLCEGISEFSLCRRFLKTNISYEEFEKQVLEYKKEEVKTEEQIEEKKEVELTFAEKLIDFLIHYGIFIAIPIIVIIIIIMRRSQKNKFDFKL